MVSYTGLDSRGRLLRHCFSRWYFRHGVCFRNRKYKNKIISAIQVCVSLESEEVKKREYAGLIEAMAMYGLHEGIILTEGEESRETVD